MTDNLNITLYRGWDDKGKYVWSPFVIKLELRLRVSHVSYQTGAGSMRTAPKGKIPYVDISEKNQPALPTTSIGDSALIAKYFSEHGLIHDLNENLDATARAHDLAIRALVEDRLYFFNVCFWVSSHLHVFCYADEIVADARTLAGQ
jgi:hypothetical protein